MIFRINGMSRLRLFKTSVNSNYPSGVRDESSRNP